VLSRGINEQCVSRRAAAGGGGGGGGGGATHPADDKCYRGGGFLDEHRGFFTPGKKFRQPAYLATSFSVRTNTHTHGTATARCPCPIVCISLA
jgi:hypothetical protein